LCISGLTAKLPSRDFGGHEVAVPSLARSSEITRLLWLEKVRDNDDINFFGILSFLPIKTVC
jgi:hypothetical protein